MKALAEPDRRAVAGTEVAIGLLLRWGVVASMSVVVLGMALTFFHHADYLRSSLALHELTHDPHAPRQLRDVWAGVRAVRGQATVMAGLILLITLPVIRVALSFAVFAYQRDRQFMAITGWVFTALMLAFVLGRAVG